MKKNAKKAILKIFFRQMFINIMIGVVGLAICFFLHYLIINKTKTEQFTDKITIYNTYIDDQYNKKNYITEFKYNNYILKSIGYSSYLYCKNRKGDKIKADLIKTVWFNQKGRPTEYQILKLHMKY